MARARLTRAVEFTAHHRYYRPEWTAADNTERFGIWSRAPGHSHTYRCEVTVEGVVDSETGMVVDLQLLDRLLQEKVCKHMGQSFLNDLPDFRDDLAIPTTENIARVVWKRLVGSLEECFLAEVRIVEDGDLWSTYRGD